MNVATFDDAWVEALAQLEVDVAVAERMLVIDHLPSTEEVQHLISWRPPTDLGPLPASLLDRARALLTRQRAAAEVMTRAMIGNRRQLAALSAMRPQTPSRPVYLDVES